MISYNWENKQIINRIGTALKEYGYRVWIDDEQMKGSILEAGKLVYYRYYLQLSTSNYSGKCC